MEGLINIVLNKYFQQAALTNPIFFNLILGHLGKGPKEKKCKNMVFDHNWGGGGGQPEPYPYCKTPLFLKTLYISSIILNL